MITIWKKVFDESNNESWVFIHELEDETNLQSDLEYLRQDMFEYRAELKNEYGSQILGV
jgi:hypothetical protein